mgnify:CR=1 FL=1
MRKIATYLSAIMLLTACITNNRQNNRILYVSIQPLQSLVDSIVGGDFEVEVLVPAGASPETFEPTPRQFVELNEAQLIFNVGLIDFETSLLGKIEQQEKVIDLSRGIDLIEALVRTAATDTIYARCRSPCLDLPEGVAEDGGKRFRSHSQSLSRFGEYETNYNRLQKELQALDARTAEKIARSGIEYFIVYHPALTYYARDYGLRQVAIEADGKEPSARQLTAIIRQARGMESAGYSTKSNSRHRPWRS